jgi:hypothetical protein
MPLALISGLPGHGKTLRALWLVEELRKKTNRPVYQFGIPGLTLPWQELEDPKKWDSVPDGSIVVIDEAWEHFPKRGPGSNVPRHVEQLAKHRHRGIDLFLISQKAKDQLDHFVRGLIDEHHHVSRIFGTESATVLTWLGGLGDPDDYHSRKKAQSAVWAYPKEVFAWYKSAELHTIKRKLPWKKIALMGAGVLAIPALAYLAWSSLTGSVDRVADSTGTASETYKEVATPRKASITAEDFVPAVAGQPFSAPFYSSSVDVSEAPIVAGCGVLKIGATVTCRCNDQQGNQVPLEHRHCLSIFQAGQFQPGRPNRYPEIAPYTPPLAGPSITDGPSSEPQAAAGPSRD